jgi:hypothetical protein
VTAGCGHMGTAVVSGPHAQKAVVSGPKPQKLLQAAQDLFDGLQSTWAHHMVSRQPLKKFHGLQNAKIVRMGRNVPKRWSQLDFSGLELAPITRVGSLVCHRTWIVGGPSFGDAPKRYGGGDGVTQNGSRT